MDSIPTLLQRIVELLQANGEENWSKAFQRLNADYSATPEHTRSVILGLYGGMGSFNDLVFQNKDGMLRVENDALSELRSALYFACRENLKH